MLDIQNRTPFATGLGPTLDKHGREGAVIAIKGTFTIRNKSAALQPSEKQEPVLVGDVYHGEPDVSSLKYEADIHPPKPGTDISLLGHAYASPGGKNFVDAGLMVGTLSKVVRVFGDRVWFKALGIWQPSSPRPFQKIPVMYEKAFGGKDFSHENPKKHSLERRNPVGTGYVTQGADGFREDMPLPNVENPKELIVRAGDKPAPVGLGLVSPNWLPRREFSGTYDEAWKANRFPFLPDGFDERFFHAASAGLTSPKKLVGGETVRYVNLAEERDVTFALPKRSFTLSAHIKGKPASYPVFLDAVVLEPDENRVMLTWKALIPCNRNFLYLDRIRVELAA